MALPTRRSIESAVRRGLGPDDLQIKKVDGYFWVSVRKGDASAKLEFHDGWVNWTDIQSPGERGWLAAAHEMVRNEFPKLGVEYLEASGGDGPTCNEDQLKTHGPWEPTPEGRLRWEL